MFGAGAAGSVVPDKPTRSTTEDDMTTTTSTATPDLTMARARNEATWRAAAVALYAGDIEEFLAHWTAEPRYSVAYPVAGIPPTVEGRDQFRALFGGFGAAATRIEVHDVRFHQTADPDVAIVEERMVADLVGGGSYENLLAIRVTFRDGLIADMYEYYGQVAHQALADRLGGSR
jgi:ketosteroid isomerase-like protein